MSATTTNFVVRSSDMRVNTALAAEQCEVWRAWLANRWSGDSAPVTWLPRCEVEIHLSRSSYGRKVGHGASQTWGSSLIKFSGGKAVRRRVDLLADSAGRLSAMPHELTHVLLADLFDGSQPPRWADEGIATLADTETKRSLHRRDCLQALQAGTAFRIADLMALEGSIIGSHRIPTFYGQSVSLVEFLVSQGAPNQLIPFVRRTMEVGCEQAVQQFYGFETLHQFEYVWRRFEMNSQGRPREGRPAIQAKDAPSLVPVHYVHINKALPGR